MNGTGKFSTHHVPDEGVWYSPGETVRLDRASQQVSIVKDPLGDYEVHSCRRATEYADGAALLRVGLRRVVTVPDPPSSGVHFESRDRAQGF
jgi:hypothetical protein